MEHINKSPKKVIRKRLCIVEKKSPKKVIRRKILRIIEKKNYWFPEELWGIVKEYAGIYNITTRWDKISKVGVKPLLKYYQSNFNRSITNATSNPYKVKKMILRSIIKIGMNEEKYRELATLVEKKKITKNTKDFTKYKVGDEVVYTKYGGAMVSKKFCGVIKKVNKASIVFKPYQIKYSVSDNPNASYMQSYEHVKYYYDKNSFDDQMTIKTNFRSKNEIGSESYNLDAFEFRTTFHDWGN